jgi:PAS domain S-box-containing protein
MTPPSSNPSPRPVRAGAGRRTIRAAAFAALAAACLLPAAPRAAPPPPVRENTAVSDDNYPPYIFRDDDGVLRGILPDEWALWEAKTGVRVDLQAMDWAEAQRVMREKRADVIETIFRTPERDHLYDFTPPYAEIHVPVFAHRSLGGLTDPSSLRGFTIGVKAGDSVIGILAAHGIDSLREYPSYEAIVQAAREDELRVFSVDEPAALYYLYKFGIEDQFRTSFVLYTGEFHRAVHKGSTELLALVQQGFTQISPREYQAIENKWMGTPIAWETVFRRFAIVLLAAGAVVLLLAGGNLVLGRLVRRRTAELNRRLAELRAAQADLQESREYLATVFDSINDALFIHDAATFQVLDVNRRMLDMYGYPSREEAIAAFNAMSGGEPPFSMGDAGEWMTKARNEGPQVFEWRSLHSDGHPFWVEISIRCQTIGSADRLIVTARDISERKQAEEDRRRVEQRIQEAQRLESLGLLAGGIAHDFNNILTSILGNIDLAMQDVPRDSTARADLATAVSATHRAADLAQQMLAYSGKGHFAVEALDVADEIQTTTQMLRSSLPRNAELQIHLPDSLPAIQADASQCRQVLMNLVLNAAEALEKQAGLVRVSAGTADSASLDPSRLRPAGSLAPGPCVFIEVTDTGAGIRPEFLGKIFEPFFSTKFTGRGLGLAAVLGIMRGHHGALQVDSHPGKGTTFRVYFPVSDGPVEEPKPPPAAIAPPRRPRSGLLLLVDDEANLRETASKLFSRLGYQVLCASSGPQAIQLLRARAGQVQGVVLDLAMPEMDGVETLAELRRIRPDLPVAISSGYAEIDVIQRFKDLHPDGFIQKPYTLEILRDALDRIWPV